jgi:hypothetical protein
MVYRPRPFKVPQNGMVLKGLAFIHSEDLAQGQTGMARPSHYQVSGRVINNFKQIRPNREV